MVSCDSRDEVHVKLDKCRLAVSSVTSLFGKRDLDKAEYRLNITAKQIEFEEKIEWDKILSRDPFNCALSLVCQLSAGADRNNDEANKIYEFIS